MEAREAKRGQCCSHVPTVTKACSDAPVQPPAQPNASSAATKMTFVMLCSSLNAFADAEPVLEASARTLEF